MLKDNKPVSTPMALGFQRAASKPITTTNDKLAERVNRLPPHLREAAERSWLSREEDYRFLAER